MPSDLRRRQRQRSSAFPISAFGAALLFLLAFTYSFASIHYHLPPYSWIDDWKHRHDKVVQHRPAFKKVERYSPEHRYRPAASPVVRTVGKDGKVVLKGQYH